MKAIVTMGLMATLAFGSQAGELKVGTVDLQKVLADYYKAQELAKQLKEKEVSYVKELEGMRLEGRKLTRETQDLQELSSNTALSATAREEKKKNFESKRIDLREFEVRYDDFRAQREAELQNYANQGKKRILDDVISTTRRIGDAEGFNLVLNANKTESAASDVLFSRNVDDITQKILASLNAAKPQLQDSSERSGKKDK
jgi:Skp family chaperone for outer membrane proteins